MPKQFPSKTNPNYRNVRAGKMRNQLVVAKARDLAEDRQVFDLKQQGKTNPQIAEALGVSALTVSNRLNRIMREYRLGLTGEVEAEAGKLIAQYEYIIAESMDAWRASKEPHRTISKTVGRKLGMDVVNEDTGEVETVTEPGGFESTTTGTGTPKPDVKYLTTAMQAMDKLGKLLRIDTPQQVQVTVGGADGGPVRFVHDINYDDMEGDKLGDYLRELAGAAVVVSRPLIIDQEPEAEAEPAQAHPG